MQDPVELDQITKLSNGVRVATEALPGHFSGIGVYVDAGSRYENDALRGASHIVDRLAFKSTRQRTGQQILEAIESLGGNIQCASSRESIMYQCATFNSAVPSAVGLLAETIRDPLLTEEEVTQQLATADYEIGEIWSKPELILPELVHLAAYKDNTIGNPLLCPKDRLEHISKSTVDAYMKHFYRPESTIVAFAGVNHSDAVKLTERYFGDMKPSATHAKPATSPTLLTSTISSPNATQYPPPDMTIPSHYTGGFLSLPPIPPPPNPALPRLSYIHVAFEALPISSPDIYALAVLQTLLGGGGSFSAGGPGKGMYSRLYTNVLNQHSWIENCVAFNHSYTDSGIFGIGAACAPTHIRDMLEIICRELYALTLESGYAALGPVEVQRAKNQLRSSLLMNLESRLVELEDLGRQVQVHGHKIGVKEMCRRIEDVSIEDLRRVAGQVVQGRIENVGRGSGAPTVVLQEGEKENVTTRPLPWQEIQERIARWKLGAGR